MSLPYHWGGIVPGARGGGPYHWGAVVPRGGAGGGVDREGCGADGGGEPVPDGFGTVYVARSWGVVEDGILRGHVFPVQWSPGWNEAICLRATPDPQLSLTERQRLVRERRASGKRSHDFDYEADPPRVLSGYLHRPCKGLAKWCACGFFAYTDPSRSWRGQNRFTDRVEGIIQVAGDMIVGPIGLRAQRAKIVALLQPAQLATLDKQVAEWAVQVEALPELPPRPPLWVLRDRRRVMNRERLRTIEHDAKVHASLSRAKQIRDRITMQFDKVRARHSDVPVFIDREEMLRQFPVESLDHLINPPDEAA